MIEANAAKINAEANDIDKEAKERYEKWGKEHPYLRNTDETISRYFRGTTGSFSKKLR